jgi:hypothetical protein
MTQKANPSVNRPAGAFKTSGAIAYGGHGGTGFVKEGSDPTDISVQDSAIDETALNSFEQSSSASSLTVTIDPGEAFVFGSWICKDTESNVTLESGTAGQTVFVGWNKSGPNDVIVGLDSAFASASGDTDKKIPLFDFDTDGTGVTNVDDRRLIGDFQKSDDAFIGGDTLESGKRLVIESDEQAVVGGSYTLNGDAQIDGDLVTVSNQESHDSLADVDPTDHLEVIKEYQITAQTGATPAFDETLSNALAEELTAFDVTVTPTGGLNDTYAFNFDDGKRWNNGSWDVPLTVNWDEDPGSDLDLTVRIHKRT